MWQNYSTKHQKGDFKKKIGLALNMDKLASLDSLFQFGTMKEETYQLLVKIIILYKRGGLKDQKKLIEGRTDYKFSSTSLIALQGLEVEKHHKLLTKVHNQPTSGRQC